MSNVRRQLVEPMTEEEIQEMEQSASNNTPRYQSSFYQPKSTPTLPQDHKSMQGYQQSSYQQSYFPARSVSFQDYQSALEKINKLQEKYEDAKQEIAYLKAGDLGTDWEIYQNYASCQTWITTKKQPFKLMDAIVKTVSLYHIEQLKEPKVVFFITFQFYRSNETKTLMLGEKELDSPILIKRLESIGVYLILKHSVSLKQTLLKRQILETLKKVGCFYYLPYYAGWNEGKYEYANEFGSFQFIKYGITSPYLKRYFYNGNFENSTILDYLYRIFDFLGTELTMLILTISTGAMLQTLMKPQKFCSNVLFLLDAQVENVGIVQALLQIWDTIFCTKLSNKKKLQLALVESRDEIVLLSDEGSKYELGVATMLQRLVKNGTILTEEGTIVDFQAIPVLLTNREKTWQKECDCTLKIPFYGKTGNFSIDRGLISCFYHHFCDWLNNIITSERKINGKYISNYDGKLFASTYTWLTSSYSILQTYFQSLFIDEKYSIDLDKFGKYIRQWLIDTEKRQDMDLAEEFIFGMKQLKNKNSLMFVTSFYSQAKFRNQYVVSVDNEFIYIFPNTFSCMVNYLLPGCSSTEVYRALIEEGSAKEGDGGHLFPKCSIKTSDKRERMAKINRSLILSDAEYLLEV